MRQPTQNASAKSLAAHAPVRQHTGYRRSRAAITGLIGIITAVNGAIIVRLWLQNGGVTSVHTVADAFTTLGRITGLLGAYSLLIQVLLLARLPFVEPLAGFDHLTIWHRLNGKVCLYLVLAHVVLITVGYAGMDHISIPREVSNLLTGYPGMVTATIGTGLMIVVVITSLVIVRRRLRYEAWYLVHLMAYAAILLGWFHQIPTGNEFVTNRTAATYWTALYAVTLALLILFRLIQPVTRGLWHQMRVAEVTFESITTVSLRITGRHLDHLHAHAGQFGRSTYADRPPWRAFSHKTYGARACRNDTFTANSLHSSQERTRYETNIHTSIAPRCHDHHRHRAAGEQDVG